MGGGVVSDDDGGDGGCGVVVVLEGGDFVGDGVLEEGGYGSSVEDGCRHGVVLGLLNLVVCFKASLWWWVWCRWRRIGGRS